MTDDRPPEPTADDSSSLTGRRDSTAFWVPGVDRQTLLLVGAVLLAGLHVDELVGLHSDGTLLFGWLPVHFGYHLGLSLVHVGFLLVVYYSWPIWNDAPDDDPETD